MLILIKPLLPFDLLPPISRFHKHKKTEIPGILSGNDEQFVHKHVDAIMLAAINEFVVWAKKKTLTCAS